MGKAVHIKYIKTSCCHLIIDRILSYSHPLKETKLRLTTIVSVVAE